MKPINRVISQPERSPKQPAKTAEPGRVLYIPARSGTARPRDFSVLGQPPASRPAPASRSPQRT